MIELACDSCFDKTRNLDPVQSYTMPSLKILLCCPCMSAKYEPRWCVILAAASKGLTNQVVDCITNKKYIGEPISAVEVL